MASREDRLSRAREIIRRNPELSKEKINARLKDLYGVGLRHSAILSEKRSILQSPRHSEPPRASTPATSRPIFKEEPRPDQGRERRLSVAREIIRREPSLKKEEVNEQLKTLFGVGLRHSVILKEKRDIFKYSPGIMPEKNLTTRYIKAIFGSQHENRFAKLVGKNIWNKDEALALSNLPLSRIQYLEAMASNRENLIKQMKMLKKANGWTKAEYKQQLQAAIDAEYKERGWLSKKDKQNQIFRMVDDFRQSMIDEGEDPSPGGGKHVIKNPDGSIRIIKPKGNTRAQKARYRDLHPDTIREGRVKYRESVRAKGGKMVHGITVYPRM